jgi:LPXTG-motif cell wall-anchored protein
MTSAAHRRPAHVRRPWGRGLAASALVIGCAASGVIAAGPAVAVETQDAPISYESKVTLEAPVITEQPRGNEVAEWSPGTDTAEFTSSATADGALSGQWQVSSGDGWTDLPGKTASGTNAVTSTLSVTRTRDRYGDSYRIVWSNEAGSTTSNAVAVGVHYCEVTAHPADVTVSAGDPATFTVEFEADSTPNVQWQVSTDGGDTYRLIVDANRPTYTITATRADQDGNLYRAEVENAGIVDRSDAALLTVDVVEGVAPSAAQGVTATQTGPGEVTITWRAPAEAGSSAITGYRVGYGTSVWGNGTEVGPGVLSQVFTGLRDGEYQASVTALSDAGDGARVFVPFQIVTAVPAPAPPAGPVTGPVTAPAPAPTPPHSAPSLPRSGARAPAAGTLPKTGGGQTLIALTGLTTLLVGGVLVGATRRRRSA